MRNSVNIVVSAIVVMALAVLLLAGCQDNYKGLQLLRKMEKNFNTILLFHWEVSI